MRSFIIVFASLWLLGAAAHAADSSPISGQLPDTANNFHVYIFELKKNGISLRMTPKEFCSQMDYGEPVFPLQQANDETGRDDHKVIVGELNWVICRFKNK
jgi:hypothetical protein